MSIFVMANPEMDIRVVRGSEPWDVLTVFELPFECGKEWDDRLSVVHEAVMADIPIKLAYAPRLGLHLYIGDHGYFLGHIISSKPCNLNIGLYDRRGRQYIRVVILFQDGSRWATAFFVEGKAFTPLVARSTMDRRIQELRQELESAPRVYGKRHHAVPYEPHLEKLSRLDKCKDEFYSATDLQVFLQRKRLQP